MLGANQSHHFLLSLSVSQCCTPVVSCKPQDYAHSTHLLAVAADPRSSTVPDVVPATVTATDSSPTVAASPSHTLSRGAIAGAVIGAVAAAVIITALAALAFTKVSNIAY